ncbi:MULTISPECIES: type II toxin-antitoxin system RelE/ParE family toxin [Serratia]|uniref:type II toxin-antitoxin system RelE/ParE family toxin n=1 Tax=Serratia TaxID=613 RepID=UPI000742D822|nr:MULTISPECIES: type II toxin-antitoxin system RelE/ParE family toxin [Serratia]ALX93165.1 addiction module toxin RelE [Serratia fonticola]MBP0999155.1 type II toxin-antitoxin system RelE/ParE family toxin [Serratia fonticola]MBP1004093.1 type II toxin-antitoxin system RelE/ParE family toxin [Serratia fonticola]MBP1013696.1 type II toxin-antitoxin system RelE/ParE family toxin [Serratia fonticola]NYA44985.1 type II toxin-antitoxin system RelE/ParE family toxin [Serratia fonticola]
MRIEWDDVALQDRERIFEFLYPLNSLAAEQVDDEIELAVESLLENPEMGRPWYGEARKLVISKASLLLIYVILDEVIKVLAVAHQREKFPN